jgi:hypothetical protein
MIRKKECSADAMLSNINVREIFEFPIPSTSFLAPRGKANVSPFRVPPHTVLVGLSTVSRYHH